jgi:bla regulator protein BlaR1
MIHVTQSPFLQALGYAIINSLWQFALLWLVYFFINSVFKQSPQKKYAFALLLQLTGFVWFAVTLAFYYQQYSNAGVIITEYANRPLLSAINTGSSTRDKLFSYIIKTEQFLPYLSIAYLFLLIFLSFKWLHCYQFTQNLKQKGISKINVDWRLFVQRLSEQLGITGSVKIFLSDKVKTPLTIGFLKPVILIPLASINHLSTEQMEAVILHELAHIKRSDYLINLLLSLIEATLFFNPFMQLLSRHIKRERENSCDDWVLQYDYNAATYARALLKIATLQTVQPSFGMNAAGNKDALLIRVKRMIEKSEKSFHYRHQLIALLFITTTLSTIAWLSPEKNKVAALATNKFIQVKTQPLAAKVENPLFNPVFFLAQDNNEEMKMEMEKEVKHIEKHMQKMMSPKPVPLAVPTRSPKFDLTEIPAPVIKNASPLAKNKMLISPRLIFNIDTLRFTGDIKKLFTAGWMTELEKTEKDARKNLAIIFERNAQLKQPYDKEKVLHNINVALAQIRATKLKMQKLPSETSKDYTRTYNSYLRALAEAKKWQQDEDLKPMAEEMKKQWEEAQQQYFYLTRNEENMNFNVQLPAVVYTAPDAHSYSFEFTDKPQARVAGSAAVSNTTRSINTSPCAEIRKKVRAPRFVNPEDDIEEDVMPTYPSAPEQPVKKVINRPKRIIIVHI